MDDNRAKTEQCLWCGVSEGGARLVYNPRKRLVCEDEQMCAKRVRKRLLISE